LLIPALGAAFLGTETQRKGNVIAVRILGPKKPPSPPPSAFLSWLRDRLGQ
jgi:hypothetical protein